MPALTIAFLDQIAPLLPKEFPTFVETGTFLGETVFAMEPLFQELHTIEVKSALYYSTRSKYRGPKIFFHLGDSAEVLHYLVRQVTSEAVFFLDGHWSGGITGRGSKDCPLLDELKIIVDTFQLECVIIIDDCRLFETHDTEDWSEVSEKAVREICDVRLREVSFLPSGLDDEDRMVLRITPI